MKKKTLKTVFTSVFALFLLMAVLLPVFAEGDWDANTGIGAGGKKSGAAVTLPATGKNDIYGYRFTVWNNDGTKMGHSVNIMLNNPGKDPNNSTFYMMTTYSNNSPKNYIDYNDKITVYQNEKGNTGSTYKTNWKWLKLTYNSNSSGVTTGGYKTFYTAQYADSSGNFTQSPSTLYTYLYNNGVSGSVASAFPSKNRNQFTNNPDNIISLDKWGSDENMEAIVKLCGGKWNIGKTQSRDNFEANTNFSDKIFVEMLVAVCDKSSGMYIIGSIADFALFQCDAIGSIKLGADGMEGVARIDGVDYSTWFANVASHTSGYLPSLLYVGGRTGSDANKNYFGCKALIQDDGGIDLGRGTNKTKYLEPGSILKNAKGATYFAGEPSSATAQNNGYGKCWTTGKNDDITNPRNTARSIIDYLVGVGVYEYKADAMYTVTVKFFNDGSNGPTTKGKDKLTAGTSGIGTVTGNGTTTLKVANVPGGTSISFSGDAVNIGSRSVRASAKTGYIFSSWTTPSLTVHSDLTICAILKGPNTIEISTYIFPAVSVNGNSTLGQPLGVNYPNNSSIIPAWAKLEINGTTYNINARGGPANLASTTGSPGIWTLDVPSNNLGGKTYKLTAYTSSGKAMPSQTGTVNSSGVTKIKIQYVEVRTQAGDDGIENTTGTGYYWQEKVSINASLYTSQEPNYIDVSSGTLQLNFATSRNRTVKLHKANSTTDYKTTTANGKSYSFSSVASGEYEVYVDGVKAQTIVVEFTKKVTGTWKQWTANNTTSGANILKTASHFGSGGNTNTSGQYCSTTRANNWDTSKLSVDSNYRGVLLTANSTTSTSNVTTEFDVDDPINTYTITYKWSDGTTITGLAPSSYTSGTTTTLATVPTQTGYTTSGWYTTSACTGNKVTSIGATETGNKTFYAKKSANGYAITYKWGDGTTITGLTPSSYTSGTTTTLATVPTQTGYAISGWYTTSACTGNKITSIGATETGDKTFYAKKSATNYTLTIKTRVNEVEQKPGDGTNSWGWLSYGNAYFQNTSQTYSIPYGTKYYVMAYDQGSNGGNWLNVYGSSSSQVEMTGNVTVYIDYYTLTIKTRVNAANESAATSSPSGLDAWVWFKTTTGSGEYLSNNSVTKTLLKGTKFFVMAKRYAGDTTFANILGTYSSNATNAQPFEITNYAPAAKIWYYTLTLNKGTGIASVSGAGTYLYEASPTYDINISATPASGYVFSNWTTTEGNSPVSATSASTKINKISQKTTLTANAAIGYTFNINTPANYYIVTRLNGSTGSPGFTNWAKVNGTTINEATYTVSPSITGTATNGSTAANTKITLPTLSATGYTFNGWSNGTSTYAGGTQYTITAPVTFTAQWSRNPSITAKAHSATATYNNVTATTSDNNYYIDYYTVVTYGDAGIAGTSITPAGSATANSNISKSVVLKGTSVTTAATVAGQKTGNAKGIIVINITKDNAVWANQAVVLYNGTDKVSNMTYNAAEKKYVADTALGSGTYKVYVNGCDTGKTVSFTATYTRTFVFKNWEKIVGPATFTVPSSATGSFTVNGKTTLFAHTKYSDAVKITNINVLGDPKPDVTVNEDPEDTPEPPSKPEDPTGGSTPVIPPNPDDPLAPRIPEGTLKYYSLSIKTYVNQQMKAPFSTPWGKLTADSANYNVNNPNASVVLLENSSYTITAKPWRSATTYANVTSGKITAPITVNIEYYTLTLQKSRGIISVEIFDSGAISLSNPLTLLSGSTVSISASYDPISYEFGCWNTEMGNSPDDYLSADTSVTVTSETVLTAYIDVWNPPSVALPSGNNSYRRGTDALLKLAVTNGNTIEKHNWTGIGESNEYLAVYIASNGTDKLATLGTNDNGLYKAPTSKIAFLQDSVICPIQKTTDVVVALRIPEDYSKNNMTVYYELYHFKNGAKVVDLTGSGNLRVYDPVNAKTPTTTFTNSVPAWWKNLNIGSVDKNSEYLYSGVSIADSASWNYYTYAANRFTSHSLNLTAVPELEIVPSSFVKSDTSGNYTAPAGVGYNIAKANIVVTIRDNANVVYQSAATTTAAFNDQFNNGKIRNDLYYVAPQNGYMLYPEFNYSIVAGATSVNGAKLSDFFSFDGKYGFEGIIGKYNPYIHDAIYGWGTIDSLTWGRDADGYTTANAVSVPYDHATGKYRHYIPLWYIDGADYITMALMTDAWTPGGCITQYAKSNTIEIDGNFYDHWHIVVQ